MAFAPPGPKSLARVVNRCMSKKIRFFMVKQGRADCYRVQDLSIVRFYTRSNNSPPTRLRGFDYLAKVIIGIKFKDGVEVTEVDQVAA